MGDPKTEAFLAARKAGVKIDRPVKLTEPALAKLITDGVYMLTYDGQGLQKAGPSNSNPDSTWYNFNIANTAGQTVGHFHIHPDKRKKCGYASGNMRLNDDSSFGSYLVGRATDWQWVGDWLRPTVSQKKD